MTSSHFWIVWLVLLVTVFTSPPARGADGLLTVEETLDLVTGGYQFTDPASWSELLARRAMANPAARPAILRILADAEKRMLWSSAYIVLGHIGTAEDVAGMVEQLRGLEGVLDSDQNARLDSMGFALARLADREVANARDWLDRMMTREFWHDMPFREWEGQSAESLGRRKQLSFLSVYALMGDHAFPDKALESFEHIEDEPSAGSLARWSRVLNMLRIHARYRLWRATGQWPRETWFIVDAADLSSFDSVVSEAEYVYSQLKAVALAKQLGTLMSYLLKDGQPADTGSFLRFRDAFSAAVEQQISVWEALDALELQRTQHRVRNETVYWRAGADEVGRPVTAKMETVSVTFRLEGSESVGREFFPDKLGSLTVAEDGTLIVVMKKIEGAWRWNPFGW